MLAMSPGSAGAYHDRQPREAADLDIGVIYTYERHYMPRLLSTLAVSGEGLRLRLLLVDNASADGVAQWLPYFPATSVIRNPRRLRYAANVNRVLKNATAPLVLLLNTDMYFDPAEQCLAKMVQFMHDRPECGVSGCRLHHADGAHAPSARRFPTVPAILARRCGLGWLLRGALGRYLYQEHAPVDTWACEWLAGCFLLVRREAYADVGPLDERFHYFEDVDFCQRMWRAGWQVMYHGGTYCYHIEHRASKMLLSRHAFNHLRSYLRWLWKWRIRSSNARPTLG
jgi:GT2 family glycosyltransferase